MKKSALLFLYCIFDSTGVLALDDNANTDSYAQASIDSHPSLNDETKTSLADSLNILKSIERIPNETESKKVKKIVPIKYRTAPLAIKPKLQAMRYGKRNNPPAPIFSSYKIVADDSFPKKVNELVAQIHRSLTRRKVHSLKKYIEQYSPLELSNLLMGYKAVSPICLHDIYETGSPVSLGLTLIKAANYKLNLYHLCPNGIPLMIFLRSRVTEEINRIVEINLPSPLYKSLKHKVHWIERKKPFALFDAFVKKELRHSPLIEKYEFTTYRQIKRALRSELTYCLRKYYLGYSPLDFAFASLSERMIRLILSQAACKGIAQQTDYRGNTSIMNAIVTHGKVFNRKIDSEMATFYSLLFNFKDHFNMEAENDQKQSVMSLAIDTKDPFLMDIISSSLNDTLQSEDRWKQYAEATDNLAAIQYYNGEIPKVIISEKNNVFDAIENNDTEALFWSLKHFLLSKHSLSGQEWIALSIKIRELSESHRCATCGVMIKHMLQLEDSQDPIEKINTLATKDNSERLSRLLIATDDTAKIKILKELFCEKMNPNRIFFFDKKNVNVFYHSITKKSWEVVKLFLEYGANPNVIIKRESLLSILVKFGDLDLVRLALQSGADPNLVVEGNNPLLLALEAAMPVEMTGLLLSYGANSEYIIEPTPIQIIVGMYNGDLAHDLVKLFIDAGARPADVFSPYDPENPGNDFLDIDLSKEAAPLVAKVGISYHDLLLKYADINKFCESHGRKKPC